MPKNYKGKQSKDKKQDRAIAKLQKMVSPPEVKWVTTSNAGVTTTTAGVLVFATPPVQGTTNISRIGEKIQLIGMSYRFFVYAIDEDATASLDDRIRITFFRVKNLNNAGSIAPGDIFTDSSSLSGFNPSSTNRPRFFKEQSKHPIHIYKDVIKGVTPAALSLTAGNATYLGSGSTHVISCVKKFPHPISCTLTANAGALADCLDNWVIAYVLGSSVDIFYDYQCTLYYTDA